MQRASKLNHESTPNMTTPRHLCMIGTGYVGLVSGTCFAELGFRVTCVDVDAKKIADLQTNGKIPIYEPGLTELVQKHAATGRLTFTTNLAEAVPAADAIFIAVGTPQGEDGSADLQYVAAAARQIAPHLKGYTVIVNKSTVPVGTGKTVEDIIRTTNPSAHFAVVSNPEFLREGEAVPDFLKPDRVVVGTETAEAAAFMAELYKPLTDQGAVLHSTNRASAELIKYASNAFLATKITFINELIPLCEAVGADILSISKGMGLDARIAPRFLQPGPGYGGSCFPKDTHALAKIGQDAGVRLSLVEETIAANQRVKEAMVPLIAKALGGSVQGRTVAVLGLAFKANTDDMREASCLTILPALQAAGARVVAFDPVAMAHAAPMLPGVRMVGSLNEAVQGADAAVVLTEWAEFRAMDLHQLKSQLKTPHLIDLRNIFTPQQVRAAGLTYTALGRPLV
jgi:UDPglucose 6-dehydrogenase